MIKNQEIFDFINEQDPLRPIKWLEPNSSDDCGCLMVHYAKEKLGITAEFFCGIREIYDSYKEYSEDRKIFAILENPMHYILGAGNFLQLDEKLPTYGDLQAHIKEQQILFP